MVKLVKYNLSGKTLGVMQNIYSQIKSCIFMNGEQSENFQCHQGLREGEKE